MSAEDLEEGKCGLLKKAMYGTRNAAQNLEMECTEMKAGAGFRHGSYSACEFYHKEKNDRVVVRGGGLTSLGPNKSLD